MCGIKKTKYNGKVHQRGRNAAVQQIPACVKDSPLSGERKDDKGGERYCREQGEENDIVWGEKGVISVRNGGRTDSGAQRTENEEQVERGVAIELEGLSHISVHS